MKKISVDSLKAGLIFSEPVFIEGDNILVPAGAAIRKKDIERLQTWGVTTVETNGVLLDPNAKAAASKAKATPRKPAASKSKPAAGSRKPAASKSKPAQAPRKAAASKSSRFLS